MTEPLVSICIPVYNNSEFIAETMRSVALQTYRNIELVVVDDNSQDDSLSVIMQTADNLIADGLFDQIVDLCDASIVYKTVSSDDDSERTPEVDYKLSNIPDVTIGQRVIYVYHNNENLGMSGNWNHCMELCRGEYIKLICADDQIAPELVEREEKIMQLYPGVLLVESDTEFRNNDNKPSGSYNRYGRGVMDGRKIARHSLFTRDYFGAPLANLIRTSAYKELGGFDPAFSYIIDYDFFMKLGCHGSVYVIREPLNFFRIRSDSNTGEVLGGSKGSEYVEEHRRLVNKYSGVLGLSEFQISCSVAIRRLMNFLGGIYLKLKLHR